MGGKHHVRRMPAPRKPSEPTRVLCQWPLNPAATLGSSVRIKGILQEVQAHLSFASRKLLHADGTFLVLRVPEDSTDGYEDVRRSVDEVLVGAGTLPVIPREVEDILSISSAERHRWLKDGRLKSAGTRTVKLRGRARQITFHVFDPRHIEDVLDGGLPDLWREQDAMAAAENRRMAAGKAAMARAARRKQAEAGGTPDGAGDLDGWDVFESLGILR
ncbi:hypothetical protein [Tianweitania sediminis]|nr:hypothetical protein [Tianweitania sediminis]